MDKPILKVIRITSVSEEILESEKTGRFYFITKATGGFDKASNTFLASGVECLFKETRQECEQFQVEIQLAIDESENNETFVQVWKNPAYKKELA